jgi:nicotinamidase-related amidase
MPTALLIIDVQAAMTSGQWEVFDSRQMIARINHVARLMRTAGESVIVVQHEEAGGPMQHGGDGWQLDADLDVAATDILLRKTASDAFHKTDLHTMLQARGVTSLIACGLQSELCVDSTVRRALALGYPVTLVADAHSTIDNGVLTATQISAHHNVTLSSLDSYGPRARAIPAADVRLTTA